MNYQSFKLYFKEPIVFKNNRHAYKEGFYLLFDKEIRGEASPLPGFSIESMADILNELPHLDLSKISEITDPYFDYSVYTKIKSLQFALSMLVNRKIFKDINHKEIKIQGLLQGDSTDIQIQALALDKQNVHIAKMKVGRNSILEEKKTLEFILNNTKLQIRLDANQSLRLSRALDFLKDIPKERIDYLEEPLQNPKELDLLYSKTQIPFALDENIQAYRNIPLKGLKALVLKPTLLGDFKSLRDIISDYTRTTKDLQLIVSSSYESEVGLEYLKIVALKLNPEGWHGLDTGNAISHVEMVERGKT